MSDVSFIGELGNFAVKLLDPTMPRCKQFFKVKIGIFVPVFCGAKFMVLDLLDHLMPTRWNLLRKW